MIHMRSYGKAYGAEIAFDMTELLEYIIVCYGVSTFVFDSIIESIGVGADPNFATQCKYIQCFTLLGITWRVNITSIICIVYGLLNAFGPMDKVNTWIFGEYPEIVSETPYCV